MISFDQMDKEKTSLDAPYLYASGLVFMMGFVHYENYVTVSFLYKKYSDQHENDQNILDSIKKAC